MRFDDTLETVLAADVSTPFGKASAWRQLTDLIGRRRASADARALQLLARIRRDVPTGVRAASARALAHADVPYALIELCADDDIAVVAPLLRGARLNSGEWVDLLPRLSPAGRQVVRDRRDLPAGVEQALAVFAADFTLAGEVAATSPGTIAALLERIRVRPTVNAGEAAEAAAPAAEPPTPAATPSTFVSIGAAAMTIPVVAAALQQANDSDAGRSGNAASAPVGDETADGPFEIAEVVARIDAFYTRQPDRAVPQIEPARTSAFRFETDEHGIVRWVDGVTRGPLIGLSLEMTGMPGLSGVDGSAAGAFRRRDAIADARLFVTGESDAAGDWRISANAAFDPATGRFAGYRGTARRPRSDEQAAPRGRVADSLRQLMHELRTPTNAIAGFAEMIEHQMLGDAPTLYRERAATIRDHARALLAAIDDLDIAARIEASALELRPGEVALRPLLVRIVEDLAPLSVTRGAAIGLSEADAAIAGDPRAVERMLARLLATLVSAAGEGERIDVTLSEHDDMVAIGFSRPHALSGQSGEALFGIDDEREGAALLGTGFALRLVRNLARELSGALVIEADLLSIRLPLVITKSLEVVR